MHPVLVGIAAVIGAGLGYRYTMSSGEARLKGERLISIGFGAALAATAAVLLPGMAGDLPETEWPDTVRHIDDRAELAAFIEAQGDAPVLIAFHAPWCAPCRATAPALSRLADDGVAVGLVDVDRAPTLAEHYQIRATPSILVYRQGAPAEFHVGVQSMDALQAMLQER